MARDLIPSRRLKPTLKPILRAYVLAYLAIASPRLLTILLGVARGKSDIRSAIARVRAIIGQHAGLDRFPAVSGFLVGGSIVGPQLFNSLTARLPRQYKVTRLATSYGQYWLQFIASFGAAWGAFHLLNLRPSCPIRDDPRTMAQSDVGEDHNELRTGRRRRSSVMLGSNANFNIANIPPLAGKTLDLTMFAFVRAVGVVVDLTWSRYRAHTLRSSDSTRVLETLTAPAVFAFSSCIIMFNWFYSPDRLPSGYRHWINSAAQIDPRLIEALRQCRYGNFVYDKDTGLGPLLRSMCRDLGYPEVWGDPAITVPVPCELVHCGTGPSCEWHGISRFVRGWSFAMKMYLPLNLLMLSRRDRAKRSLIRAFIEASQSSAFLGVFVASFYYAVCLARTRLGPKLFSKETVTPMMWDGGLCVGAGCMACGWSILLEKPARQQEIAFFVAPRALATIFPRRYERTHMSREQLLFALSTATILVAAQRDPDRLQGVFGRLLSQVFQ